MAKTFALTQRNSCMCAVLRLRLLVFTIRRNNKSILQKRKLDTQNIKKYSAHSKSHWNPQLWQDFKIALFQAGWSPSSSLQLCGNSLFQKHVYPVADNSNAFTALNYQTTSKLANTPSYIRILMTHFPMNPVSPWTRRWHLKALRYSHSSTVQENSIRNKPWPLKIHLKELNVSHNSALYLHHFLKDCYLRGQLLKVLAILQTRVWGFFEAPVTTQHVPVHNGTCWVTWLQDKGASQSAGFGEVISILQLPDLAFFSTNHSMSQERRQRQDQLLQLHFAIVLVLNWGPGSLQHSQEQAEGRETVWWPKYPSNGRLRNYPFTASTQISRWSTRTCVPHPAFPSGPIRSVFQSSTGWGMGDQPAQGNRELHRD